VSYKMCFIAPKQIFKNNKKNCELVMLTVLRPPQIPSRLGSPHPICTNPLQIMAHPRSKCMDESLQKYYFPQVVSCAERTVYKNVLRSQH